MLFAIASTARDLGCHVTVVAPSSPGEVMTRALDEGHGVIEILADDRRAYMRGLRRWDARQREGLLWCNGLVPAFATGGHGCRIVHFHQIPRSSAQWAASGIASIGATQLLVPSVSMANSLPGTTPMPNWAAPVMVSSARLIDPGGIRLGFIGRHSTEKGLGVLAEALRILNSRNPGSYRLVLAGDARSVSGKDQRRVSAALERVGHLVQEVGWVSREEFFSQIDLAVFPSVWAETFGLVVAEAQSARIPFVISDAGALPEVAGAAYPWVARAGDPEDLARMIESALVDHGAHVEASYQRWAREYSPDAGRRRLAEKLLSLGVLTETV